MSIPETRPSLLMRLHDPSDREAWQEFCEIYRPVVLGLACGHGLQPADAEDLAQQVLMAVSHAIEDFRPDPDRAKFRTWLKTIARRAIINALTRRHQDEAAGGETSAQLLQELPDSDQETQTLMIEYRRQIFHVAAERIRTEFGQSTWQAFWQTVVLDDSVTEAAKKLGKSVGSVYTARSRVMRRLREMVSELDSETHGDPS